MQGGKGGSSKTPTVNTSALIRQNEAVNRIGVNTPFGQQNYVTDANGQRVLQTTLSPEMQQIAQQQMARTQMAPAQYNAPAGQESLLADVMSRVRGRYQPPVEGGP